MGHPIVPASGNVESNVDNSAEHANCAMTGTSVAEGTMSALHVKQRKRQLSKPNSNVPKSETKDFPASTSSAKVSALTDFADFREIIRKRSLAWPTTVVFVVAFSTWLLLLFLNERLPFAVSLPLASVAIYALFTVMHDAAHVSLSRYRLLNDGMGFLSAITLGPLGSFPAFRYVHLMHHKHTNVPGLDPDMVSRKSTILSLLCHMVFMDLCYIKFYFENVRERPTREVLMLAVHIVVMAVFFCYLWWHNSWGVWSTLLYYWVLPGRFALAWLVFSFDFLPHQPHRTSAVTENKWRTTSLVKGPEPFLTYVLFSQNYHILHHAYPMVPFYDYVRAWNMKEPWIRQNGKGYDVIHLGVSRGHH